MLDSLWMPLIVLVLTQLTWLAVTVVAFVWLTRILWRVGCDARRRDGVWRQTAVEGAAIATIPTFALVMAFLSLQ